MSIVTNEAEGKNEPDQEKFASVIRFTEQEVRSRVVSWQPCVVSTGHYIQIAVSAIAFTDVSQPTPPAGGNHRRDFIHETSPRRGRSL